MSRHEGVSCDACSKKNFRGRRYKCLICYDYDLCSACYESGAPTTNHSADHPVQCILTRSDFDMYYGGESLTVEQAQSFTCPYCGKMGFTEATLQEHLASEHTETASEVVCPVCASQPGGEPNMVTDDLAGHLTLEHRGGGPRDLISFLEPGGVRHGARRTPHSSRGMGSNRPRRCNMHYSSSSGISSLSPGGREADPIVELLTQLSGVRRSAAGGGAGAGGSGSGAGSSSASGSGSGSAAGQGSTPTQLQQLQIQLQLERQQVRQQLRQQAARQQLERLPRRQNQSASGTGTGAGASSTGTGNAASASSGASAVASSNASAGQGASSWSTVVVSNATAPAADTSANVPQANPQFLLSRYIEPTLSESELEEAEHERADHSLFVQELMLSTLTEAAAGYTPSSSFPPATTSTPTQSSASDALRGETCPPGNGSGGGGCAAGSSPGPGPGRESATCPHPPPPSSSSCVPPKTTTFQSQSSATSSMTSSSSAVIPKRSNTRVAQVTTTAAPTTAISTPTTTTTNTAAQACARSQASSQAQAQAHHPTPTAGVRGPLTTRVVTGTGTIREMVGAASFNSPGSTRRKPVRPSTEPPPPH